MGVVKHRERTDERVSIPRADDAASEGLVRRCLGEKEQRKGNTGTENLAMRGRWQRTPHPGTRTPFPALDIWPLTRSIPSIFLGFHPVFTDGPRIWKVTRRIPGVSLGDLSLHLPVLRVSTGVGCRVGSASTYFR